MQVCCELFYRAAEVAKVPRVSDLKLKVPPKHRTTKIDKKNVRTCKTGLYIPQPNLLFFPPPFPSIFAPGQRARLRRAKRSAFGRTESRLWRAITQALRARTKSPPTASKIFGLRPNGNPPSACNNTGASRLTTGALRPNKELAYGEQNLRPSAKWKPAYDGQ